LEPKKISIVLLPIAGSFLLISTARAQVPDTEARAVIGFEQAGGSATKAEQHYFFDFFIDRRLKSQKWSLWGEIRVASFPKQIDTPVAQFATDFATNVGNLKVNELAESAEFATGLDFHPWNWDLGSDASANRRFGFIFSVGASGPFEPSTRLKLFQTPDPTSPQYPPFVAQFPTAAHSPYVGFIPPDRDRFYRSWGVGIRLTTAYFAKNAKGIVDRNSIARAPATYTVTFGQDENVSGGSLKGPTGKIDAFYPLPIKGGQSGSRFLYLFGTAALRLTRARNFTPFVLAPAPSCTGTPSPTCVNITGSEPSVAIISTPSTRDAYRLGVGVDAVGMICAIHSAWCQ
jgi:hypothetical protein